MTRNNRDRSKEIQSPTASSTNDNIMDLPDLSTFRKDEKQHILDVLQRDENLRSKHLSRFMYVNDILLKNIKNHKSIFQEFKKRSSRT